MNLQSPFYNQARISKIPVTVRFTLGDEVSGLVTGFDENVILLEDEKGKQHLVYYGTIRQVTSERPILAMKDSRGRFQDETNSGEYYYSEKPEVIK